MTEATLSDRRPFLRTVPMNRETVAWAVILAVALITRLWELGDRAMSHDESLHTFYSWKLFAGEGYQHDPMMHGPLLYHGTFLSYLLFGVSDFTARLLSVLTGILLVASPLLLRRWLGAVGAMATGVMLVVSPVIMMYSRYIRHDIPVELFTVLMAISFIRFLDDRRGRWIVLALAAGAGAITSAEMSYINGFVLLTFVAIAMVSDALGARRVWLSLGTAGLGIGLLVFAFIARGGAFGDPTATTEGIDLKELVQGALLFGGIALAWASGAALLGGGPDRRGGVVAAIRAAPVDSILMGLAVFATIYTLLFTTFFTHMDGINGFYDSIVYWIEQHDVVRGGQPWYYYLLLAPLYEYVPLGLALAALLTYAASPSLRYARGNTAAEGEVAPAAWVFVPMLTTWAFGVFWIYSWAGEKMPWLLLHLVVPMTFLGGRFVSDIVASVDWDALRRRGWQLAGATVLGILAIAAILVPQPGFDDEAGAPAAKWLIAVAIAAGLVVLAVRVAREIGARQSRLAIGLAVGVTALLFNARDSVRANFANDELATEYLVYAHGTPDDKTVYELLRELDERLGTADPLAVGYDNEVSWPFTWYFRRTDWTQVPTYLGTEPGDVASLRQLDAVLIGSPNYGKFEPYLRDDYVDIEYGRMWWPNEGYKSLTRERLIDTLTDPRLRRNLANIVFHRYYTVDPLAEDPEPKPLDSWFHHANMKLYLRRDTIERAWPLGEGRPEGLEDVVARAESRPERLPITVEQVFDGGSDTPISGPKDVAVAPDGTLWVVDHDNSRIVGLDATGAITATIDGDLFSYVDQGGTLQPSAWGVGIGNAGEVYVADTWNHRVLKFVDGEQVASFGHAGQFSEGDPNAELARLFGPRDVAVDAEGNVYFTDTGNKRIIVLDADLNPIRALGSGGTAPGQFSEPTSLAFDPETGELYVADLWNLRVQVFSQDLVAVREWQVDGWGSQEAAHKAYIAVGPGGTVVVTDPAGARAWVYDRQGTPLGTLDLVDDQAGLDQPIGIAIDADGAIYIASSNSDIVTKYAPLAVFGDRAGGEDDAATPDDSADGTDPESDEAAGSESAGTEAGEGEGAGAGTRTSEGGGVGVDGTESGAEPSATSAADDGDAGAAGDSTPSGSADSGASSPSPSPSPSPSRTPE